jgi:hypothetical protein
MQSLYKSEIFGKSIDPGGGTLSMLKKFET